MKEGLNINYYQKIKQYFLLKYYCFKLKYKIKQLNFQIAIKL